ncbi:hypothetical protein [Herbiconiux sp. UC225_62]|uniref:hypothetical protein n=1 Tax=Herbiconiux sp. UC225_62 TaxID=3350168 RepID=UPI0036D2BA4D
MSQPPPDQPVTPPYPQGQSATPPEQPAYPGSQPAAPQGQPAYPPYQAPNPAFAQPAPAPYQPQYGAPGTYPPAQQPHPGYGATPPAGAPPRHPGYGPNPPSAPGPQPTAGAGARNPLGLASLLLGAVGPVLGFLFLFIQAAVFASGAPSDYAAVSLVQTVLVGLTALAAVILGLVAISRPGSPKALASAGLALGAAGLLGTLGAVIYPVIASLMYG